VSDVDWNVLVTGATKNIGLATARAFADRGANLVIVARSQDRLEQVAEELRERGGGRVVPVATDLTAPDQVAELGPTALEALGGIDVLVNNALVDMGHDLIVDSDPAVWQSGLDGYLRGPLALIAALADSMAERGRGSIVNLVSTAAFTPVRGLGAYGVMKAAMVAMNRYLAAELAPAIRVNAVCPGTTSEDGTTAGNANFERLVDRVPLKRMGTPDETAKAIVFLASDAASYTTGQVLFVDGGRVELSSGSI
jgi:NAD(P)-dependent dehydrogenase (short-subunit alcohol dehydrogenase family)